MSFAKHFLRVCLLWANKENEPWIIFPGSAEPVGPPPRVEGLKEELNLPFADRKIGKRQDRNDGGLFKSRVFFLKGAFPNPLLLRLMRFLFPELTGQAGGQGNASGEAVNQPLECPRQSFVFLLQAFRVKPIHLEIYGCEH